MTVNPGSAASSANIVGSVAVYFDPATPSVAATFSAASLDVTPTTGSRILYDLNHQAVRSLIVGTSTAASIQVSGITASIATHVLSTNGTIAVNVGKTDGTVTVRFDPGYELGSIKGINSSAAVHILSTNGTMAVNLGKTDGTITIRTDPGYELGSIKGINSSINAHIGSTAGTIGVRVGQVDGTVAVYFSPATPSVAATFSGTVSAVPETGQGEAIYDETTNSIKINDGGNSITVDGTITGITNSIAVHVLSTGGTMAVNVGKTDGTVTIRTDPGYELGSIKGINSSLSVHLLSTNGTLQVKLDPNSGGNQTDDTAFTAASGVGTPMMGFFDDTATDSVDEGDVGVVRMTGNRIQMVHSDSTASIFSVSGSTSGVSASGVTLVAPSSAYSFKVYAFSLQTTGIVSCVARFTNGGGTATEFWRGLVTANQTSSTPVGANLATGGPGCPLFATGTNTTLALHLDTATLVHYSVSYTKESA